MANYQLCDINDFLEMVDSFQSPEEYQGSIEPTSKITEELDDYVIAHAVIDVPESTEGEISKILRATPGVLPPTDCFPKTYKRPSPVKQPEYIPNAIGNRIPILLSEDHFRFNNNNRAEDVREMVQNNLDSSFSSSGGSSRSDNGAARTRFRPNIKKDDNGIDLFHKRFGTLFSDSTDDDNANVDNHQAQTKKDAPQYYNPKQIYEMKRGNKKQ